MEAHNFDFSIYETSELKNILDSGEKIDELLKRLRRTYTTVQIEKFYLFLDKALQAVELELEKRD